jgi:hypothetical protein
VPSLPLSHNSLVADHTVSWAPSRRWWRRWRWCKFSRFVPFFPRLIRTFFCALRIAPRFPMHYTPHRHASCSTLYRHTSTRSTRAPFCPLTSTPSRLASHMHIHRRNLVHAAACMPVFSRSKRPTGTPFIINLDVAFQCTLSMLYIRRECRRLWAGGRPCTPFWQSTRPCGSRTSPTFGTRTPVMMARTKQQAKFQTLLCH